MDRKPAFGKNTMPTEIKFTTNTSLKELEHCAEMGAPAQPQAEELALGMEEWHNGCTKVSREK